MVIDFENGLKIEFKNSSTITAILPSRIKNYEFSLGKYYVDFDCFPPLQAILSKEKFEERFRNKL